MVGVCEVKSQATLTHCGELWKGGGPEIIRTEPPLSALTVALSTLVIMAVLPQSCLFGAGPKRKGGRVLKDMPSCKLSSLQAC